jgi:hypothetical protein
MAMQVSNPAPAAARHKARVEAIEQATFAVQAKAGKVADHGGYLLCQNGPH